MDKHATATKAYSPARCRGEPADLIDGPGVVAPLGYLVPGNAPPAIHMYDPPDGQPHENCEFDLHPVHVRDARRAVTVPLLSDDGFCLVDAPSTVKDFWDAEQVKRHYYPEVVELALRLTGATAGFVFDHQTCRREAGRPLLTFGRPGDGSTQVAVGRIHNDHTEVSGQKRLGLVLTQAGHASAVRRYCIVNVWRPIRGPVLDTPLALCDAQTIAVADLVAAQIRYPAHECEIYLLTHSPEHRWSYYAAMQPVEALVFKQYDSQVSGTSRFTPHAAFEHPEASPDAPLRESIEARVLLVFG